jgi:hypothetical protein
MSVEQCLALLEATPVRFSELTAELTPVQLRTRPGPDEWSANEVLAHVRACADARGERIPVIVNESHPTFRAVNPLSWIEETDYLDLEFAPSLHAFAKQRRRLLVLLKSLPPEGWSRQATVTGAGAPIERSVLTYADWVARHERPHVKQLASIAASLRALPS